MGKGFVPPFVKKALDAGPGGGGQAGGGGAGGEEAEGPLSLRTREFLRLGTLAALLLCLGLDAWPSLVLGGPNLYTSEVPYVRGWLLFECQPAVSSDVCGECVRLTRLSLHWFIPRPGREIR